MDQNPIKLQILAINLVYTAHKAAPADLQQQSTIATTTTTIATIASPTTATIITTVPITAASITVTRGQQHHQQVQVHSNQMYNQTKLQLTEQLSNKEFGKKVDEMRKNNIIIVGLTETEFKDED